MINPFSSHQPGVVVALADTAKSLRLHRRLRYQVYCQQLGYEDPNRFPDGEEWDEFDEAAAHFLAYDTRRDTWIGAMRLVSPGALGLPMLRVTSLHATAARCVEEGRVAEASRICVLRDRRPNTHPPKDDSPGAWHSCAQAYAFFALIRASVGYSYRHGIEHWTFLAKRSLSRLLASVGIEDAPAGEPCQYRGLRSPRIVNVARMYKNLIEEVAAHPLSRYVSPEAYVRYSALSPRAAGMAA